MILTPSIGTIFDVFSSYPEAESIFLDTIHAANFDNGISGKGTDFHFRKERLLISLHLLKSYPNLTMQQTTMLCEAVLNNKDNRKALGFLRRFEKGKKPDWRVVIWKGKETRLPKEEAMWRDANAYAMSLSDSRFLSYVKTFPTTNFLHDAAVKCEEAAYACLKTQLDSLVSAIKQNILLVQKEMWGKELRYGVDREVEEELEESRVEFVRKIEELWRERSKS